MKKVLFFCILLINQLLSAQETELKKLSMDQVITGGHVSGFSSDEKRGVRIPFFVAIGTLVLYTSFFPKECISIQEVITALGAGYASNAILSYFLSTPIEDSTANLISSVFLIKTGCPSDLLALIVAFPFFDWANEIKKNNKINYRYAHNKKPVT